jgi:hypothetical protein
LTSPGPVRVLVPRPGTEFLKASISFRGRVPLGGDFFGRKTCFSLFGLYRPFGSTPLVLKDGIFDPRASAMLRTHFLENSMIYCQNKKISFWWYAAHQSSQNLNPGAKLWPRVEPHFIFTSYELESSRGLCSSREQLAKKDWFSLFLANFDFFSWVGPLAPKKPQKLQPSSTVHASWSVFDEKLDIIVSLLQVSFLTKIDSFFISKMQIENNEKFFQD